MDDGTKVFLFGTLRDPALRNIIFGRVLAVRPARLSGYEVRQVAKGDWPVLVQAPSGVATGDLVALPPESLERTDYYEGLFGYFRQATSIEIDDTQAQADVWFPREPQDSAGPWDLVHWQAESAQLARHAASDVMSLMGELPPETVARRWPMIRTRAQARLNAETSSPTTLRHTTQPGDVEIVSRRTPYAAFFAVEDYELTHRRFDGGRSETLNRAAFISGDAVTVLPYDPVRDRVLLIEQFRMGPLARGDAQCWSLEAIAGRIDAGETPDQAARREAIEEARLTLNTLIPMASYYPTPGAKSEFLYSFLALADLPDDAAGLGGVEDEHEDIRAHVVSFERLMQLVESGEVNNAPLLLSAMALRERRGSLRD